MSVLTTTTTSPLSWTRLGKDWRNPTLSVDASLLELFRETSKLLQEPVVFPALFTCHEKYIPARVINGKYGQCWQCIDEPSIFYPYLPETETSLLRKGVQEGYATFYAKLWMEHVHDIETYGVIKDHVAYLTPIEYKPIQILTYNRFRKPTKTTT